MTRIVRIFLEGRVKDGEVFEKIEDKPFILGEGVFLPELEKSLLDLKPGEEKQIELSPEKAYGERRQELIKIIPAAAFKNSKTPPAPGAVIFLEDGVAGRVQSTDGGRVRVDFNHPLAGKTVVFHAKVLKEVEDVREKVRAVFEALFTKAKPEDLKIKIIDRGKEKGEKKTEAEIILPADCLKHEDFQARKVRFAQLAKNVGIQKISITEEY